MADDVADSTPQTPPTVAAVFSTYELIENILTRLSLEDILVSATTLNTFRHVVERSEPLRERFYKLRDGFGRATGDFEKTPKIMTEDSTCFDDTSFSFFRSTYQSGGEYSKRTVKVYLVHRGESKCLALLVIRNNPLSRRLIIVENSNKSVQFSRVTKFEWSLRIAGIDLTNVCEELLRPEDWPFDEGYALCKYLINSHG